MKYSIEHIAEIVGGKLIQHPHDHFVSHLLTDSRRMIFADTTLFFALPGERRDGHKFIADLYNRGVRQFVAYKELEWQQFPEASFILVNDSLAALQQLTAYHRKRFDIPVIGITGSNGKTIVKEWLNQLLEDKYNIVRSPRSYNSQIGVPLSVWQMNDAHELAIFEAGISRPGEMSSLAEIIQPSIGIFTTIGPAHDEGFVSKEQKISEKLLLFKNAKSIVFGADDEQVRTSMETTFPELHKSGNMISWGTRNGTTFRTISYKKSGKATVVTAVYKGIQADYTIPFTDSASIENAISCICVMLLLRIPVEDIAVRLNRLTPIAMRLELKTGINNCAVINDSYSADLSSFQIALDFLSHQQQHPKKTIILSDILESGRNESALYSEVAGLITQKAISKLIGIGTGIAAHAQLFDKFLGEKLFFHSTEMFLEHFNQLFFRDETILLKGARRFQFEKIDRLLSRQVHETVLEIDLNAMASNLKQYQQWLKPDTKLMAMVKAFSYGSGSFEVANLLQFHKVEYLGVAYADEGVDLRKAGITMPIMVMNAEDSSFNALVDYNLEPVIFSFRLLDAFDQFLKKEGLAEFPVHVELETGMHRLGFAPGEVDVLSKRLQATAFTIRSVFSHLAASEEARHDAFTREQGELFLSAALKIESSIGYSFIRHIANSAAITRHPQLQLDMVRLGIGLYGVDSAITHQSSLQEVSTLKSTISQIQHLKAGETVGYNRRGIVERDTRIATIRIGYADGYPRTLGNGIGEMFLHGKAVPTIGSICMDMTMVDITDVPEAREGDEIIVFGKMISVIDLAKKAGTIPYEILTGISQRVRRVYFQE